MLLQIYAKATYAQKFAVKPLLISLINADTMITVFLATGFFQGNGIISYFGISD